MKFKKITIILIIFFLISFSSGCTKLDSVLNTETSHTVYFNSVGTIPSSITADTGSRVPSTGVFPDSEKEGIVFGGWYTRPYGGGQKIEFIDEINANYTLFAYFLDRETFSVTFDTAGGSAVSTITVEEEARAPTFGNFSTSTKPDAIFRGWYTEPNGQGTRYDYIEDIDKNYTLYAFQEPAPYLSITLNSDFGTNSTLYTVSRGSRFPSSGNLPILATEGHIFRGWYSGVNGTGTRYYYVQSVNSSMTLTAFWEIETRAITYNLEGGTATFNSLINYNYGQRVPLLSSDSLPKPTKSGSIFLAWFTLPNQGGVICTHFNSLTQNVSLYAGWGSDTTANRAIEERYLTNKNLELSYTEMNSQGYINDQGGTQTSAFLFGNYTTDYNGCGWIATYNALNRLRILGLLDQELKIAHVIRLIEYEGLAIGGIFGVPIDSLAEVLKKFGFTVSSVTNINDFNNQIQNSPVVISLFLRLLGSGHYQAIYYSNSKLNFVNPAFMYSSYSEYIALIGSASYQLLVITKD